jgi:hypothetical protein
MEQRITRREFWSAAVLAVSVAFITYGVLIPQLGFYRDDWYMLLTGQERGAEGLIAIFEIDRPFVGYLYAIYFRLFGVAPIGWHVSALFIKAIGGVSFLWLMRLLFPHHRGFSVWATLLYVVYPGFLQQPVAATYIHLLLAAAASILSLALTAKTMFVEDIRLGGILTITALALTILYLLIFETMIGLEAARFCMIVYLVMQAQKKDWKSALRKAVLWMLPYLTAAGGFLIWRVFFFKAARHSTDLDALLAEYSVSPLRSLLAILVETAKDFLEMVFLSWSVPLYQFTSRGNFIDLGASIGIAGIVLVGIYAYFRYYGKEKESAQDFPAAGVWLGILISLLTLFPLNLAGRNILFTAHWDRYTLHASFGGVMILAGLIYLSLHKTARRVLLCVLVAAGVITQFHSAAEFRDFWKHQRETWWQMSWRVPNLENNTLLYVRLKPGYAFFEDYEIYGPANLIYTPDAKIRIASDLINARTVPLLIDQEVKGNRNRGVYVHRNYKNALMFTYPTSASCLHVIDGRQVELPDFNQGDLLFIAPFSKIDRIDLFAEPMLPPEKIFGPPPEKNWCYYYQHMTLARQQGDWEQAASLADEAAGLGYRPRDPSEWIPVFEAYVNTEQFESADRVLQQMTRHHDMILLYCMQVRERTDLPQSYNSDYIVSNLCDPETQ